jgi:EmrB/QacA subfamily drug resistance transporter
VAEARAETAVLARIPEGQPAPRFPPGTKPIVAGLMLSMFLVALDGTIVSTAMPSIVGNLGGFKLYAWVPAVYLLATAVSTPVYGKVSDLFGRKPVLFFGIGLFLLGSAASGAANTMLFLIAARTVQGLGAGAVQPVTTTIIGDLFSLEQRARIQGFFGSVWGLSSLIGPLMGGVLVDGVGWRWIFYLNIPFGLIGAAIIRAKFHEQRVARHHKLDILGASLMTGGLTSMLLVLIEGGQAWPWLSAQTAVLSVAAATCLVWFVRQEQRAPEPTLPLDLFRSRIIAVSAVGSLFTGAVMIGVSFEVPLYVQGVLGLDALHAGLALAPMSLGWPIASAQSGKLAIRFGYRVTALIGLTLSTIGVALLFTLSESGTYALAALYSFLIGVGLGLATTPMLVAVQSSVQWARRGVATATTMFVRSFGSVVGLAVMGAIVNHATAKFGNASSTNQALDVHSRHTVPASVLRQIHSTLFTGIHASFLAALVAAVLGILAVTYLPGGSARRHEVREESAAG